MQQAHILISGYVHGVGFRRYIQKEAKKLELKGWVRNLHDRRVEAVVQGEKEKIEEFVRKCQTGPMMAEVNSIGVDLQEIDQLLDGFQIRATTII